MEAGLPSTRYKWVDEEANSIMMNDRVSIDEKGEHTFIRMVDFKQQIDKYYNKNVHLGHSKQVNRWCVECSRTDRRLTLAN